MAVATTWSANTCAPVPEAAVGGQHDRAALVAAAHDLEDPVGGGGVHRQVAELVDDQHRGPGVGPHLRAPAALEMGRLEVRHEIGRGREVGPVAGLGGGDPECDREMALADPRRSQEQRVAALLDEAQRRQLGDDRPVDRGLEVELELRRGACRAGSGRSAGVPTAAGPPSPRPRPQAGARGPRPGRRSRCSPARARPRGAPTPWRGRGRRGARAGGRRRSRSATRRPGSSGQLRIDRQGPDLDGLAIGSVAHRRASRSRDRHEGVLALHPRDQTAADGQQERPLLGPGLADDPPGRPVDASPRGPRPPSAGQPRRTRRASGAPAAPAR